MSNEGTDGCERPFQSLGPATEKARSPFDLERHQGTVKSKWVEEVNDLA